MRHFTIKAKGRMHGVLYTRDRVFLALGDEADGYRVAEYERATGRHVTDHPQETQDAALEDLKARRDARKAEEQDAATP